MRHVAVLIGLLSIAIVVQIFVVHRSVVPALDAVRFVETARAMAQHGVFTVASSLDEQPLFPAWVWLVKKCFGNSLDWAATVQLAATVPLVLTIIPIYFLTLRFLGAGAAGVGTLFFCLLPEVSRLGADGISDSTHLLFFTLASLAVIESLARKNPWLLLPSGLATGFALLTRAEVMVLPATLAIALIIFQIHQRWQQSWSKLGLAVCCYVVGFFFVYSPYLVVVNSSTGQSALGPGESIEMSNSKWQLADGHQMSFELKDPNRSNRRRGLPISIGRFAEELANVFNYGIGLLIAFGLWQLRRKPKRPIDHFVHIFFLLFSASVIWFTAREGYLHARHLLTLVVFGIGCGGYGAIELGRSLLRSEKLAWTVVGLSAFICMIQTIQPLHTVRCGHWAAAQWLANDAHQSGIVLDTRGWTGLYSNRKTLRYDQAKQAFDNPQLAYVVLERRELSFKSIRSRTLKHMLQTAGKPTKVFSGPSGEKSDPRSVIVYRWHPQKFGRQVAAHVN